MSFEEGAKNPFDDDELADDTTTESDGQSAESTNVSESPSGQVGEGSHRTTGSRTQEQMDSSASFDITADPPLTALATELMADEFHDEDPPVPYGMWRNGVRTGRTRTTIDMSEVLDSWIEDVADDFNKQYDADIPKTDIRDLALAVGLSHPEEIYAIAEEWGLPYDS